MTGDLRERDDGPGGAPIYAAYVTEQVAREDSRKESLERRGLAVITTSGALVTLLFGLAAVSTNAKSFHLTTRPKDFLVAAVAAYFLAALLAIATNFPIDYEEVEVGDLQKQIESRWGDSASDAERMTTLTRLKVLASARQKNARKANLLFAAIAFEGVATACLAIAVTIIL